MIITFDGESGSGKTTLAREAAKKIGFSYVSSGLIFRAFAHLYIKCNGNTEQVKQIINDGGVIYSWAEGKAKIFINGSDMSEYLQSEDLGNETSKIAENKISYDLMVEMVNEIIKKSGIQKLVIDGRSVGKVFYPEAEYKFYVGAKLETRVQRRYDQVKKLNPDITYEEILKQINDRDDRDKNREHFPLKLENDTKYIDNSEGTLQERITEVLRIIQENEGKIGFLK